MQVAPAREELFHGYWVQLAVLSRSKKQFGAVGEKLRRAAFIRLHVRRLMHDHAVVGLAEGGERKRIGRSAGEDEIDVAVRFKELAEELTGFTRERIVAIGRLE